MFFFVKTLRLYLKYLFLRSFSLHSSVIILYFEFFVSFLECYNFSCSILKILSNVHVASTSTIIVDFCPLDFLRLNIQHKFSGVKMLHQRQTHDLTSMLNLIDHCYLANKTAYIETESMGT